MNEKPTTARTLLEGWVRDNAVHLVGPVLDVGTTRAERSWIQVDRMTLDASPSRSPDLVADLEDLTGLPDGAFGSVICTEVLEHVARPERALTELRRVTAPGGSLLLSVPWIYPFHPCPLDLRRFTLQGLVRVVEDTGWTVCHAGGIPIHPEAHAHLIAAVKLMTGGRCPSADSLGWSNWVIRATA